MSPGKINRERPRSDTKPPILNKLLKLAGQDAVAERPSVEETSKSYADKQKDKIPTIVPRKSKSASQINEKVASEQDQEILEARRKKFESAATFDPKHAPKKTISLKGIVSRTKKKSRQKKEGESSVDDMLKESKISDKERKSDLPKSKSGSSTDKPTKSSSKITQSKRLSRESVKSTKSSNFSDSDSDAPNRKDNWSESDSDSEEDSWRDKKSAVSERNRDDIERERRQRIREARQMESQKRREKEKSRVVNQNDRGRAEKSDSNSEDKQKFQSDREYSRTSHNDRYNRYNDRNFSESSGSRDSKVKEHRHKKFVEIDDEESEENYGSRSGSRTLVTTVVKVPHNVDKDRDTNKGDSDYSKKDVKERVQPDDSVENMLKTTDARHLIKRHKKKKGDDEEVKHETEKKRSPTIHITFNKGRSSSFQR